MENAPQGMEHLELMLFRVNGVLFGSELHQVKGVFAPEEEASTGVEITRLNDSFFGEPSNLQGNWKLIRLKEKSANGSEWEFLAEDPEDIVNISIDDIRPLPAIVGKLISFKSLWGSFIYKGEIGLLLDLAGLCVEIRSRNTSN